MQRRQATGMRILSRRILAALTAVAVLAFVAACFARPADEPVAQAAIASAHPLATQAGEAILQQGGNAFDAAIAVAAVLAVVEPYSSGIGGGGFWLLHIAKDHRDVMLDARERAPLAAHRDMYLDANGEVIAGATIDGPLAAGIPGEAAALAHLARHYGRLPLATSLQPAIKLAREGFAVDAHYQRMAQFRLQALNRHESTAAVLLHNAAAPAPGHVIVQRDLARTLRDIAVHGAAGFYQGEVAQKLVAAVRAHGGIWSMQDLAQYRVIEREPIQTQFFDMRITSAAPPSSGGIALTQMLHMLQTLNYPQLGESQRVTALIEVMRRAYRDRAEYLGDTDFVAVPVARLLSAEHNIELLKNYDAQRATPSAELKAVQAEVNKAADTTHYSIIDQEGNRVAATLSINYPFGACFIADGTGVLLNDEMDDFSARPGTPNAYGLVGANANAIAPGKRMLSSMSPAFIETPDRVAVLGTPGGSRIITMVLRALLDFYDGGDAASMVTLPRFHHQYLPDKVFYEAAALSANMQQALQAKGYALAVQDGAFGNMQVVVQHKHNGQLQAAADSRGAGLARVFEVVH